MNLPPTPWPPPPIPKRRPLDGFDGLTIVLAILNALLGIPIGLGALAMSFIGALFETAPATVSGPVDFRLVLLYAAAGVMLIAGSILGCIGAAMRTPSGRTCLILSGIPTMLLAGVGLGIFELASTLPMGLGVLLVVTAFRRPVQPTARVYFVPRPPHHQWPPPPA